MRILITGSHGFIGSHLTNYFLSNGVGNLELVDYKINKSVKNIGIQDLQGVDAVIHLAALISTQESYKIPRKYLVKNTLTTYDLAIKCIEAGVKKFIFTSSASVYGNPISPYGVSKLASESMLSTLQDKMSIYNLRLFNVYGYGQSKEYAGVITKFMDAVKNNKPLVVNGDGEQTRSFIYVQNVVDIIANICLGNWSYRGHIDVCDKTITINNLAEKILEVTKKKLPIEHIEKLQEIRHSKGDNSTLLSLIPDFKFISLHKGLKDTYEAINTNNNN